MTDEGATTVEKMNQFLDWTAEKGELTPTTAKAIKSAVRVVLAAVEGDQVDDLDVRSIDVESTLSRFANLTRAKYSQDTMKTYRGRFRQAVTMFIAWTDDDPNWKITNRSSSAEASEGNGSNPVRRPRKRIVRNPTAKAASREQESESKDPDGRPKVPGIVYPLVRDGVVIGQVEVPHDLRPNEAESLAGVLKAIAAPNGAMTPSEPGGDPSGR